jgi:ABC-type Zn2+ transport system substrate-binding protein/surface adhesin
MSIFRKLDRDLDKDLDKEIRDIEHKHELKLAEIESNNKLAMKEKEFELKHFKDEEMQNLKERLSEKTQAFAVLQKENEMLQKITNLNADIIDIKDLVANLINKLPEVKINSLSMHADK